MKQRLPRGVVLTSIACLSVLARPVTSTAGKLSATGSAVAMSAVADLRLSEFVFDNDKAVRVHVVNSGGAASPLCILRLTVRKINGLPVGRVVEVKLPPLVPGKDKWLVINAKSILPNNVSLEATTFKLNADATSIVAESNEANNELWHNL